MPRLGLRISPAILAMLDDVCRKRGYEDRSHGIRTLIENVYQVEFNSPPAVTRLRTALKCLALSCETDEDMINKAAELIEMKNELL